MVKLIEHGAVGGFANYDNRYSDPLRGLQRTAYTTTCIDFGSFYVEGHSTPNAKLEEFEHRSRDVFALPLSKNRKFDCALSPVGQGFGPANQELLQGRDAAGWG